jgi:hypothetical protein
MIIKQVEIYRDGGTRKVTTDVGVFFIGFGQQAEQVFDNWPKSGNRCYEYEPLLPDLAKAFECGQREVISRMYNDWQVDSIATDYAIAYTKHSINNPIPLRFTDWFKTLVGL